MPIKNFKQHVDEEILLEKVSQKEYKDAAADKNIMIGIEYEVVNSSLISGPNSGIDMDQIKSDYDDFVQEIVDYGETLFDSRSTWEDDIDEEQEDMVNEFRKTAREARKKEEDLEEDKELLEDEIRELEDEIALMQPDLFGDNKAAAAAKVKQNQEKMLKKIESLESEIEEADGVAAEAESEAERVEDMGASEFAEEEGSGEWDGEYPPSFDPGQYGEWIENNYGEGLPDQDEIRDWVFDAGEYGMERINSYDVQGNLLEYLPYPEDDGYDQDSEIDEDSEAYNDLVSDVTKGEYPIVGGYHSSTDYTKWRIEDDSSLNAGGAEIISPVLTLKDGIESIKNMFKWIKKYADTDNSTGLHINMSFKNYDMSKFDWLKLLMFIEEGAIYKEFSDRKNNFYARPIQDYLNKIASNPDDIGSKEYFKALSKAEKSGFQKIKDKMGAGKFFGINFSSIAAGSKDARIEFRYLGGNYHTKEKEVIKQILKYAAWMKIALDPAYKRKEYLKKLSKIALDVSSVGDFKSILDSLTILGRSQGVSGDKSMELAYDKKRKLIIGFDIKKKILYQEKLSRALTTPRIKQFLVVMGISISKLIKTGNVVKDTNRATHYMDALRKFNPAGKVSRKEMDAFIIKYKQPK